MRKHSISAVVRVPKLIVNFSPSLLELDYTNAAIVAEAANKFSVEQCGFGADSQQICSRTNN